MAKSEDESDKSSEASFDLGSSSSDSEEKGSDNESKVDNKRKIAAKVDVSNKSQKKSATPAPITNPIAKSSTKPITKPPSLPTSNNISIAVNDSSTSNGTVEDITKGGAVTTDAAAKKLIFQYLKQQNRPYSSIQINDNLHGRIPKAMIERALSALSATDNTGTGTGTSGGLICKEYGKAKIYFIDQSLMVSEYSPEELGELEQGNADLKNGLEGEGGLLAAEKRCRSLLAELLSQPADSALESLVAQARGAVGGTGARLAALSQALSASGGGGAGGGGDMASLVKEHNFFRSEWVARKLKCSEAVELLSEGLGKKTKELVTDLGIETDAGPIPANLPDPLSSSSSIRRG
jgi:26S proteasome regulatory subunit (ATPase 3-interacting protein)